MVKVDNTTARQDIYVVSNRLRVSIKFLDNGNYDLKVSSGGLASVVFHNSCNSSGMGGLASRFPTQKKTSVRGELARHHVIPAFFGEELADRHYNGFSS